MSIHQELFAIAATLKASGASGEGPEITDLLSPLDDAAHAVGKSFSGSWQGYHSLVYYDGFEAPPAGARFSQEWGLMGAYGTGGSRGDWREYTFDEVKEYIERTATSPDLEYANELAEKAADAFEHAKSDIASILQNEMEDHPDAFLEKLKAQLEKMQPLSPFQIAETLAPKGQLMTRDTIVVGQGQKVPPHIALLAQVQSIRQSFAICAAASEIAAKAASHLERKSRKRKAVERIGTNVFIGHGRSHVWRELKDFVQGRLKLPWDEFNRVPVAGVTNIARLSEMLDAAAVAFLVMTGEDEMADGAMQARMNVTHEAGLFQGRLGFTKAIVLLEEGCQEFSNIAGLGQIRFPKGNIAAIFEEIRRVLERESLVD